MGYKKHLFGVLICLLVSAGSFARTLSDQARVSLLTCAPGEALYEHFGLKVNLRKMQRMVKFVNSNQVRWVRDYLVIEVDGMRVMTH